MANWDKKYFVTDLVQTDMVDAPWNPKPFSANEAMRLIAMDSQIKKGAFYMELAWFWPGQWPQKKGPESTVKEHSHPFDEAIAFVGNRPEKPLQPGRRGRAVGRRQAERPGQKLRGLHSRRHQALPAENLEGRKTHLSFHLRHG